MASRWSKPDWINTTRRLTIRRRWDIYSCGRSSNSRDATLWPRFCDDGRGTQFFNEPAYHMFDFLGNGAEQVITFERTLVRVYGYRNVKPKFVKRDSEYQRNSAANHTQY